MTDRTVFISYVREDIDAARRLYQSLKAADLDPWWDVESLRPGETWKLAIRRAIRESRYFLAVLSRNSVSRTGYVNTELKEALEVLDMHPDHKIYLVPVRLESCEPSSDRLRELTWLDMFPDWDAGIRKLLVSLGASANQNRAELSTDRERVPVIDLLGEPGLDIISDKLITRFKEIINTNEVDLYQILFEMEQYHPTLFITLVPIEFNVTARIKCRSAEAGKSPQSTDITALPLKKLQIEGWGRERPVELIQDNQELLHWPNEDHGFKFTVIEPEHISDMGILGLTEVSTIWWIQHFIRGKKSEEFFVIVKP